MKYKLTIEDILDWETFDIKKLEKCINLYFKLDGININKIKEDIYGVNDYIYNINSWFYAVYNLIWEKVYKIVEKKIMFIKNKKLNNKLYIYLSDLDREFSPSIDYLNSYFNNFLDNICRNSEKSIMESFLKDALKNIDLTEEEMKYINKILKNDRRKKV